VIKATGANAGSAGVVTFSFVAVGAASGMTVPVTPSFTKTLTVAGTDAKAIDFLVDCSAYGKIKLLSVANGDAAHGLTGVNAEIFWKVKRAY